MLAGRMKRKHFLLLGGLVTLLVLGGVAAAGVAGGFFMAQSSTSESPKSTPTPMAPEPVLNPQIAPVAAPAPAAAVNGPSERDVDKEVMRFAFRPLGSDKLKDVTKGRPYKVNLYQDSGKSQMNRAKVDLNRNDKWDEKWTFDGPNITREVAPADDENYTEKYIWNGKAWAKQ
ncbi:MAG: hypothetical protein R3B13_02350 [Polyangiaceae bacterium]